MHFIIHLVTFEVCDENADCIEGQCVCNENYIGDGMSCEQIIGKC